MADGVSEALAAALGKGPLEIGQVRIEPFTGDRYTLCHTDDFPAGDGLSLFSTAAGALEIATFDDAGRFRPLKTAPNLRRGWVLELQGVSEVQRALGYFYPGRLEVYLAAISKRLAPVALRATLNRQSGMYRVAANITDEEMNKVVFEVCRSDGGCLRTILWKKSEGGGIPSTHLPPNKFDPAKNQTRVKDQTQAVAFLPLLCQEACAVLIEACRRKARPDRQTSS